MLNYIEAGKGVPVFLIHGMAASLYDWESLMPALDSYGYRALAVDLPGHGGSDKPEDPQAYKLKFLYSEIEEWIDSFPLDEPIALVGHSLGGHICLKYALRHPQRVGCLALIDPLYSPKQLSPLLQLIKRRPALGVKALSAVPLSVIDFVLAWDPISTVGFSPQARHQIAIDYKRASPHILHIPRTIPDLTPKLRFIHAPCLVIWGEKDLTLNPASFPKLISKLPNAKGIGIAGCGHQPHIGQPQYVNRLIINFFNSNFKKELISAPILQTPWVEPPFF